MATSPMKVLWLIFVAMSVAFVPPAASAQSRAPRLEGHSCAPMRWEGDQDRPRVALSTPVRINGRQYWFQIDTAAWPNIIYDDESDRRGWTAPGAQSFVSRSFEAGGAAFEDARIIVRRDMGRDGAGGTLGLITLTGKLTVIDYRRMRLCILPRTADIALAREASWMSMDISRGSPRIAIEISGQTYSNMIFDTGSSMFPLLVDLPLWSRLTGHAAPSDAPLVVQGTSWGRPRAWRGAPTRDPITIGNIVSQGATVFVDESNPTGRFAEQGADGILGNAMLWDHVVLLDLRDLISDEQWAQVGAGAPRGRPRFGLVE